MPAPALRDVEALARDAALDRLIDELRGRPDRVSHWLARALRVDLALITAHPELTFPSVWRHGHAVREPAAVSILRPLLDAWRDQHALHANTIVVDGAQRTPSIAVQAAAPPSHSSHRRGPGNSTAAPVTTASPIPPPPRPSSICTPNTTTCTARRSPPTPIAARS